MYVESGRTVIFSAVLLRMLMAYFLPRLLPDLKVSPLVPPFFYLGATSKGRRGEAEVGFTPLNIFQTVTAFLFFFFLLH